MLSIIFFCLIFHFQLHEKLNCLQHVVVHGANATMHCNCYVSHFLQVIDPKYDVESFIGRVQVHAIQQYLLQNQMFNHSHLQPHFSSSWILGNNKTASFALLGMEELQQITRTVVVFERGVEEDSRVVRFASNELNSEG